MKRYPRPYLLTFVVVLFFSIVAAAVEDPPVDTSALRAGTAAEPIQRMNPDYPDRQLRGGAEGWVSVSFVITTSGQVSNIVVEDIAGSPVFAEAAIAAVEKWIYKPATWDGKAVEQCSNNNYVAFSIDSLPAGLRTKQYQNYRRIRSLIESGELAKAEAELDRAFKAYNLNHFELGHFYMLGADLARRQGRSDLELEYLQRAYRSERAREGPEIRQFLQRLFLAEVESQHLFEALETYKRLLDHRADIPNWNEYEDAHEQIVGIRDSNQVVTHGGVIPSTSDGEWGLWKHRLLKRSVEFTDLEGEFGRVEFRCDRKYVSDKVAAGKNWTLPESWGNCSAYVFGKSAATFKLHELAAPS